MEETGCKIICGAPTTLAVKGLKKKQKPWIMVRYLTKLGWASFSCVINPDGRVRSSVLWGPQSWPSFAGCPRVPRAWCGVCCPASRHRHAFLCRGGRLEECAQVSVLHSHTRTVSYLQVLFSLVIFRQLFSLRIVKTITITGIHVVRYLT